MPCTARPELALTMSVGIVVVQTNTTLVLSSLGDCAEKLDSLGLVVKTWPH